MSWHWKELIPIDRFTVRLTTPLSDTDKNVLTLLYQPLIGALASSLYMTLYYLLEKDQYWCEEHTHRQLMGQMGLDLQTIYEERKKLEAIGLLKTFKKSHEEHSTYLYQLRAPMSPAQFFKNDVYSVFLYNRIGKNHYLQLRERFSLEKMDETSYEELTYSFGEVFTSLQHSELSPTSRSETLSDVKGQTDMQFIDNEREDSIKIYDSEFDYELMKRDLSSFIVPDKAITPEVKDLILRLAFVYQIAPLEMSRIISQAMVHDEEINLIELRKRAQEWYKMENGNEPPALGMKTQPLNQRVNENKPTTEEEKTIHFYETTPPLLLLEIRSDGSKPAAADVKIIESLLIDHQLNPGVVNVLMDYVLWQHDMKLSKAFIDKVAGHWARKKVKTVPEAMKLAKFEQEKKKAAEQKQGTTKQGQRKNSKQQGRQEQLPDWLVKDREQEKKQQNRGGTEKEVEQKQSEPEPNSDAKKRFEAMLKKLNNG
ncbi:DNA replication protein DnaB [Alkalihalobacillus alcalophilus ATCC 27647 = CGMCC 1.3604]|uniref:DNA replication protein DnaB n=1 Tax=Alkalihalobacillus alcalophilus ATCC 27647 = CGMCC 1.3604 TaxID=1218173 RepID=A0A094WPB5_ALKAL|nr:DnaD domain protein [Alkalihalobacillus alcalophilus]KGA97838.1 helicase DnaB [Alkalihalobacillus alcalophilus ATCC 27647 = CGMCC 1.3604]MED1563885.1 DnaD domain protein [Alkalihalobacillus alcalophilus]THG90241.1 DNA replication protein DnaB [Alkalihalobacillus alcalophilus ATCC 27647 = CGMCC 1.3604]